MTNPIYTVGCSTHTLEHFLDLLKQHAIETLADVRSTPYSRLNFQFNRESLANAVRREGIEYAYFGKELGARSDDARCYVNGKAVYDRIAATPLFQSGLQRLREDYGGVRVALMCAEKDPIQCHRTILVARKLVEAGVPVIHILEDGKTETHDEALSRLLAALDIPEYDLFRTRDEAIADAYRIQGDAIAYAEPADGNDTHKGAAR